MNRVVVSSTYDPVTGTKTDFYGTQTGTKDSLATYMKEVTFYKDGTTIIKEGTKDHLEITVIAPEKPKKRGGRTVRD